MRRQNDSLIPRSRHPPGCRPFPRVLSMEMRSFTSNSSQASSERYSKHGRMLLCAGARRSRRRDLMKELSTEQWLIDKFVSVGHSCRHCRSCISVKPISLMDNCDKETRHRRRNRRKCGQCLLVGGGPLRPSRRRFGVKRLSSKGPISTSQSQDINRKERFCILISCGKLIEESPKATSKVHDSSQDRCCKTVKHERSDICPSPCSCQRSR